VLRGQRDGSLWPYSRFSRQEPLLFYQVAPQLYSRGWVDPVPDPLLIFFWWCRESNPGLRICSQELCPLDHRGGQWHCFFSFVLLTNVPVKKMALHPSYLLCLLEPVSPYWSLPTSWVWFTTYKVQGLTAATERQITRYEWDDRIHSSIHQTSDLDYRLIYLGVRKPIVLRRRYSVLKMDILITVINDATHKDFTITKLSTLQLWTNYPVHICTLSPCVYII
jgi:hypothetical protein